MVKHELLKQQKKEKEKVKVKYHLVERSHNVLKTLNKLQELQEQRCVGDVEQLGLIMPI